MNKIHQVVTILLLISLSSIQTACASSSCVFDKDYYTNEYYADKKDINHITWNNGNKTAKIETNNGEMISIKHWSCDHIGLHAVMLIGPYSDDNFAQLQKYFLTLAAISLEKQEYKVVVNQLKAEPVSLKADSETFNIKNDEYSEFYLKYTIANESLVVEIKFYKS